ncbi:hypothetical protein RJT34_13110 [Clitoria ternatea]|uniref:Uncharacterized protein n=1 Tax=Clitoria ternatea TaxID=43366 RepID=A0AAN9PL52_CLITE
MKEKNQRDQEQAESQGEDPKKANRGFVVVVVFGLYGNADVSIFDGFFLLFITTRHLPLVLFEKKLVFVTFSYGEMPTLHYCYLQEKEHHVVALNALTLRFFYKS